MNLGHICKISLPLAGFIALTLGCNKKEDNTLNYTNAINTYYRSNPSCLWTTPVKFPVQVDTSDAGKTAGYDALVDQGLLARTTDEKKVMLIASKQVNNYDISNTGRSAWTADPDQPGFGNFCYGHRKVSSIDGATPTTSTEGATTQVVYHYTLADVPVWASARETETAYPRVRSDITAPQPGSATLINTNDGWKVAATSPPKADSQIVQ
jgi:hypothetical protein